MLTVNLLRMPLIVSTPQLTVAYFRRFHESAKRFNPQFNFFSRIRSASLGLMMRNHSQLVQVKATVNGTGAGRQSSMRNPCNQSEQKGKYEKGKIIHFIELRLGEVLDFKLNSLRIASSSFAVNLCV